MRCLSISSVSLACFLSVLAFASSAPLSTGSASASLQIGGDSGASNGGGLNGLTNILSQIDLPGLLRGVNSFVKLVGVFCPPLSQVLDNVIQNVTSTAFRVFGRLILQSGGLGGGGGGSSGGGNGGGEQRVSVVLPTFPPDEDYDDEEDTSEPASSSTDNVPLVASPAVTDAVAPEPNPASLYTSPAAAASDDSASNLISRRHARVARSAEAAPAPAAAAAEAEEAEEEDDQEGAESAPQPEEDLATLEDDQDRNKRFLPFGGHVDGHAGGGSGNFLFDIIRNTADRAARTVGTVYRMVAGTEHFGWGASATPKTKANNDEVAAQSAPAFQLVAGSGASDDSGEKDIGGGGVVEVDVQKEDGEYHNGEGIPGPITRLFVIANRGVANLVQDLILRLAQTSERLVNFKARLITSLI